MIQRTHSVFFGIMVVCFFLGFILRDWNQSAIDLSINLNILDEPYKFFPSKTSTKTRIFISPEIQLKYITEFQTNVEGWLADEILYVYWIISQFQYQLDIFGGIGEIGVHHGKLTCYLYLLRRYTEQILFAVDVFDNQALNKDGSGKGNKEIFFNNVKKYTKLNQNDVAIYGGSSLDLNPVFSTKSESIKWWKDKVVSNKGLQLVSIDGGHTTLLTYSDLCVISNGLMDGGVVAVDDITHPAWLGVRDGVSRFLAETSTLITDVDIENELSNRPNQTNLELSKRIVAATTIKHKQKNKCSRLVPFLQYYNKLFLTTPNFYPHYIELLNSPNYFGNEQRSKGIFYLEYHVLRLTIGNVPVWTDNHELNNTHKADIFKQLIVPDWFRDIEKLRN